MRQVVLERPGQFIIRDVPPPEPGPGEALVRIRRVGVCGSDLHAFRNTHPAYSFPRVLGHELGGDVVSINGEHAGISAGDRCAIDAFLNCGTCRACRRGRRNCCESLQFYGIHVDGGMQEFMAVPVELLHASARLTHDQLALIEPLGVGANGVRRGNVQPGDEVLVVGLGPIGLAAVQFALDAGATVRAVEPLEWRRALVARLGVEVMSEPDGRVADVVIDATGRRDVMERSVDHVAPGGRLVFLSVVPGRVSFDDWQFHRREMSILASRASLDAFPDIITRIEEGRIDTSLWITDRMALEEVPDRFEGLLTRANGMKVMVHLE
ncbi:zinc-binding alcohol dehydrogenase family protein [soil metagenome]